MRFMRGRKRRTAEIHPDEILIDSQNVGDFDQDRFEGRIEQPLGRRSFLMVSVALGVAVVLLTGRAGLLQLVQGTAYAQRAENNQLEERVLFADRGIIVDRTDLPLAYNERLPAQAGINAEDEFAHRVYAQIEGIAHVIGYVKGPAKDSKGFYYRDEFLGMDGVERAFNDRLAGKNGVTLTETDAHGDVVSQSTEQPPEAGEKITLSIDATVTKGLYTSIANIATQSKFNGGSGVVIDVHTGEILALTNYPEYAPQALSDGDSEAVAAINKDTREPFLNRAVGGLYAPGSIVKPIVALGALAEGVIDEHKQILSTGSISLPNPYDPKRPSIFKDWRANGWTDARRAIAVSSDIYFYAVGGGFQDQLGLGIERIDKYFKLFGFGSQTGIEGFTDAAGEISTVAWKAKNFPGDPWRIGDTYHTAIGQYGTQITPLQAARAAAALASGKLVTPTLIASSTPKVTVLDVPADDLTVAQEGMRMSVTDGIAGAVNFGFVQVAGKTGTAQVGMKNEYLNSWLIGFWPYEKPRYAFAIVLERGPAGTLVGASAAAAQFFQWMHANDPHYLQ